MHPHDDDTHLSPTNIRNALFGAACVLVVVLLCYFS